ncbi:MAG: MerR family transcriptional regulator [Roseiarcus sp.]
MQTREFVVHARIDVERLDKWLSAGWLIPRREDATPDYSDIDLARAHLIRDLSELGVNDEAIPIVLDLVDQLHGMRRAMRELLATVRAQDTGVAPRR